MKNKKLLISLLVFSIDVTSSLARPDAEISGSIGPSGHAYTYNQSIELPTRGNLLIVAQVDVQSSSAWSALLSIDGERCGASSVPSGIANGQVTCLVPVRAGVHQVSIQSTTNVSTVYTLKGFYQLLKN